MVGLIPLLPAAVVPPKIVDRGRGLGKRFARFLDALHVSRDTPPRGRFRHRPIRGARASSSASSRRARLDPAARRDCSTRTQFLSPHGLRALSQRHRDDPFRLDLGGLVAQVDYEPGESTSGLFGGNSNWRGPVWFPLNYLTISSLRNWDAVAGRRLHGRVPDRLGSASSGSASVADDLARRLVSIWLPDADGRRPVYGSIEKFQTDPEWHDLLQFHEYFHGDTGAGIGASHQTGWTGLVAHLICRGGDPRQAGSGVDGFVRRPERATAAGRKG